MSNKTKMMKIARLTGIKRFEITDMPMPHLKPGWVLVGIRSVGVCGSDIHYYSEGNIGDQIVKYPFSVGHECAGVVEEIGKGVKGLRPGMRVAIDPAMPCGNCYLCKMGRENICLNMIFLGCPGQTEGSLSEYLSMPAENCFPIPDSMTFDEAVMTEPLAIAVHAVQLSGIQRGESIAVLGSGPIGLLTMMTALEYGAGKAFSTDIIPERVIFAQKMGATKSFNCRTSSVVNEIKEATSGRGVDIAFECAGEQDALDQAAEILRPGGRLMILGIPKVERVSFVAILVRRHEILIQNVRRQNRNVDEAIRLVSDGRLDAGKLVTHRYPFDKVGDAYDLVSRYADGVIKAMVTFGSAK
jgi:L-iditol 2-dehydrogenase